MPSQFRHVYKIGISYSSLNFLLCDVTYGRFLHSWEIGCAMIVDKNPAKNMPYLVMSGPTSGQYSLSCGPLWQIYRDIINHEHELQTQQMVPLNNYTEMGRLPWGLPYHYPWAWISNYIQYKMSIPKLQWSAVKFWEWISEFIPHCTGNVFTYPRWDLSKSLLVKGAPGDEESWLWQPQVIINSHGDNISAPVYKCTPALVGYR